MKHSLRFLAVLGIQFALGSAGFAQTVALTDSTFKGLEFRSIGPALTSGRIADIAIQPSDPSVWYIATASGGVWKTTNAGTTWDPIFEDQKSYSIGCVTIDPSNPSIIWVGTGENVGGRHVGFGDGVYRSDDGGETWEHKGLPASEHISKIIVHPENSDIVWVAAQGPLWSSGGERGLYKSTDGGATWTKTLGDDVWVGVTDIAIDPDKPDRLYAATWQRHRTVAAYLGGGPGTAIYRSEDGGDTWTRLTNGLPTGNMGKIGLAVSPQEPDIVYAAIELDRRTGGVYRSTDMGASWTKMSDTVSGATGPHYYQELYASPHQFDRLYLVDTSMRISTDGGKTFVTMNESDKHVDNHAVAFRDDDPNYLLVGTDGGLYETFDLTQNWRFVANLPVTQFYKVALDDAEPFYNVFGGTQDNGTLGGPSQTDHMQGIQNADWHEVLSWDGYQPATEPGNPDIMYAQRQEGNISRLDMKTGEQIDIQPQPAAEEDFERYNWDAPILVSPHNPARLYFASQRVWKSEDRGDSWTAISGDITRDQERITLPIMGRTQSWDNAWDFLAMSNYNTITSLAESPKQEGLIYAGTDDGLVVVTEDGGQNWRKVEVGSMQGVPATAFVNDVKADLFDANVVYVALDNHKNGDFTPYLVKSSDRGRTWKSIRSNLPDRTIVWRVVQDHVDKNLIFAGTEFGIYATLDGGASWWKMTGGLPTIAFRDLAIQRRENDLVGASFGRGFYILDDYTALRTVSSETVAREATLFSVPDAWWYVPRAFVSADGPRGSQGDAYFMVPNPPFGAVFTYYLKDGFKAAEDIRKETEKKIGSGENIPFPGWDKLDAEREAEPPRVWLTVSDANGNVVRRVAGETTQGFHRVAWDLRYPAPDAVPLDSSAEAEGDEESGSGPRGLLAAPGTYTVTLSKQIAGVDSALAGPASFKVVPLREGSLEGSSPEEAAAFWRRYEDAQRTEAAVSITLGEAIKRAKAMETALSRTPAAPGDLDERLTAIRTQLQALDIDLHGSPSKRQVGEKTKPTIGARLFSIALGVENSTYGPTQTHRKSLELANTQLSEISGRLEEQVSRLDALGSDLIKAGGPWVEGGAIPE